MAETLDIIYIWEFLVNSENVLLLAFVKYKLLPLYSTLFFLYFLRLKTLVFWRKIVQNLLVPVHLFFPKNSTIDFKKTSTTEECLVGESCPTPRILYRLVYS